MPRRTITTKTKVTTKYGVQCRNCGHILTPGNTGFVNDTNELFCSNYCALELKAERDRKPIRRNTQ